MAGGVTIKMAGFKELGAALDQLPKATAKATAVRVLKKAGEPIRAAAQASAPARPAGAPDIFYGKGDNKKLRRPGTDKALWQMGTRLSKNQARLAKKEGKDFAEVYVGTRDPVARILEFGTVDMPAHPMIRPAWSANAGNALATIGQELGTEIDKSAKRLARKAARLAAKGRS